MSMRAQLQSKRVTHRVVMVASAASAALISPVMAQDDSFSGQNSFYIEQLGNDGSPQASPYAIDGLQSFNEFSLSYARPVASYRSWQADIRGVINDSAYRASRQGLVPETLSLTYVNGESRLPYRLRLGDSYSFLSYRTLQGSIKGAELEMQPRSGSDDRHSVILLGGAREASWRESLGDHVVSAISWLAERPSWGSLSMNAVYSMSPDEGGAGIPDSTDWVASVSGQTRLPFGGPQGALDFELARSRVKIESGGLSHSAADTALLIRMGGEAWHGVQYALRFEDNGPEFRPSSAVVAAGRLSREIFLSWLTARGYNFRFRWQSFRENRHQSFESTTDTYGIRVSGPLYLRGSADLNVYWEERVQRGELRNDTTPVVDFFWSYPLAGNWVANGRGYWQSTRDQSGQFEDADTREIQVAASRGFLLESGIGVSITPGVTWRRLSSQATDAEWHPGVDLRVNRRQHSASLRWGLLSQQSVAGDDADARVQTLIADYQYLHGPHTMALHGELYKRQDPAGDIRSYRVSMNWTYRFAEAAASPAIFSYFDWYESNQTLPRTPELLAALAPGLLLDEVQDRLQQAGISAARRQGAVHEFDVDLFTDIPQRQQLILLAPGGLIERIAMQISLPERSPGSGKDVFDRVREQLIATFGSGEVAQSLPDEATFPTLQWRTPMGVIRLGVQAGFGGRRVIEIQHAYSLGRLSNTRWGIGFLQ